ncbi:MAG: hypothetical protein NC489_28585 [Ruminococcus flavefaciens]|nr:hypothetical protein [Ruminococcus flavefaciens]
MSEANIASNIVNEVVVIGRKKRRLIDKQAKLWQRLSYWTSASDVEFGDGKSAEQKVGNINGITSDYLINNEKIAASSALTYKSYNKFNEFTDNGKIKRITIIDGKPYIEYKDGADTVLKKLGNVEISDDTVDLLYHAQRNDSSGRIINNNVTVTITKEYSDNYKFYIFILVSGGAYYAAVSKISDVECGLNGYKLFEDHISCSSPKDSDITGGGDARIQAYLIPPQDPNTEIRATISGMFSVNLYGIK